MWGFPAVFQVKHARKLLALRAVDLVRFNWKLPELKPGRLGAHHQMVVPDMRCNTILPDPAPFGGASAGSTLDLRSYRDSGSC